MPTPSGSPSTSTTRDDSSAPRSTTSNPERLRACSFGGGLERHRSRIDFEAGRRRIRAGDHVHRVAVQRDVELPLDIDRTKRTDLHRASSLGRGVVSAAHRELDRERMEVDGEALSVIETAGSQGPIPYARRTVACDEVERTTGQHALGSRAIEMDLDAAAWRRARAVMLDLPPGDCALARASIRA